MFFKKNIRRIIVYYRQPYKAAQTTFIGLFTFMRTEQR